MKTTTTSTHQQQHYPSLDDRHKYQARLYASVVCCCCCSCYTRKPAATTAGECMKDYFLRRIKHAPVLRSPCLLRDLMADRRGLDWWDSTLHYTEPNKLIGSRPSQVALYRHRKGCTLISSGIHSRRRQSKHVVLVSCLTSKWVHDPAYEYRSPEIYSFVSPVTPPTV